MSSKPANEQYQSSITWAIGNPLDESQQYDIFKWKILSSLLCDGHNSPFYQELIETQYGEDFSINSGLDSTTALLSFSMGLNNLSLEKVEGLESKIIQILNDKVLPELSKGSESKYTERIDALLHQIELNFKKHKPDFGLGLLSSVVSSWVNGLNPIKTLQVENILNRFKEDYSQNGLNLFKEMVENTLLNENTQRFKFTMEPSESFSKDLVNEEAQRLNEKVSQLNEEDKDIIYQRSKMLLEKQQKKEDVSVLPTLTLKDISRTGDFYPLQFTNCLTNLAGTSKTSIVDLETKIQRLTGGITFNVSAKTDPYNIGQTKLKYLINAQNQINVIAERGHSYANAHSNAQLTPTKYVNDLLGGLEQVKFITELNQNLEKRGKEFLTSELLPILQEIRSLIVNGYTENGIGGGFEYNLVGDKDAVIENETLVQTFDSSLKSSNDYISKSNQIAQLTSSFASNNLGLGSKTLINLPFPVGYASLAKLGAEYTSKDGASLQVLSQLLTFKHLHSVIREANGAYGGGLNFDGLGGTINYYSYRDPNPLKSIDSFKATPQIAVDKITSAWDLKDLQEAKLAIFQSVDAPSHIASQGSSNFLEGITDEMRQERRERFLDVNQQDLQFVAEKYLVSNQDVVSVIGDAENLKVDPSWEIKSLAAIIEA
ncbi:hypothetical protein QCA50_018625 [Cerrena zonata]|uniref:Presequence protease, mitochondrial n=1 Tax=Cerrena zonata TaxID=2478898 RepID=A0AAW0FHJ9_9APHY